ncbi:ribonuclease HIII, partial [bacterium]|nr:ribonuclease HIII [bacterium]
MNNTTKKVIGADEVGVGDYFGGIVTCAVFLDETLTKKISYLDIKDSKKLS